MEIKLVGQGILHTPISLSLNNGLKCIIDKYWLRNRIGVAMRRTGCGRRVYLVILSFPAVSLVSCMALRLEG